MKQVNYKKLILPNIPYVFIGLLATKLGQAARLSPGADFSAKVLNIMDGISMAFSNIMPSFHPIDLLVGITAAVIIRLVVYFKGKNAKKFRKNLEYGSARCGAAAPSPTATREPTAISRPLSWMNRLPKSSERYSALQVRVSALRRLPKCLQRKRC